MSTPARAPRSAAHGTRAAVSRERADLLRLSYPPRQKRTARDSCVHACTAARAPSCRGARGGTDPVTPNKLPQSSTNAQRPAAQIRYVCINWAVKAAKAPHRAVQGSRTDWPSYFASHTADSAHSARLRQPASKKPGTQLQSKTADPIIADGTAQAANGAAADSAAPRRAWQKAHSSPAPVCHRGEFFSFAAPPSTLLLYRAQQCIGQQRGPPVLPAANSSLPAVGSTSHFRTRHGAHEEPRAWLQRQRVHLRSLHRLGGRPARDRILPPEQFHVSRFCCTVPARHAVLPTICLR